MHAYRPDIDGLRALAILPVLFFHAGLGLFEGGYVGVDVFFVISGYLITKIIYGEISAGNFSILKFYERRARRILPALFAVCAFSFVAAWWLFVPLDFQDFSRSLAAAMLFASNILFMGETGYFAQPSEVKPLLHTWSLAVEEQFYIVFPVLLAIAAMGFRRFIGPFVVLLLVISFAACIWATDYRPVYAFFLSPTRAWELLMGSVLAIGLVPAIENRTVMNVLSVAGLALVLWAIFMFTADTGFPGWQAAIPCLGAALLIYANGSGETWGARLLSLKPFVWIGLISYSLYLWHWPLIVFAKYAWGEDMPHWGLWALIALSFVAAALSWRFVEQPFRRKTGHFSNIRIFAPACFASGLVLTSAGLAGHYAAGFPGRWSPEVLAFAAAREDYNPDSERCHARDPEELVRNKPCVLGPADGKPSFMVWGDSHADALMPAFKDLATKHGVSGWFASYGGCPPLLTVYRLDRPASHKCRQFNEAAVKLIAENGIRTVFLISRWTVYSDGHNEDGPQSGRRTLIASASHTTADRASSRLAFAEGLERTLAALKKAGARTVLVEQVPEHHALIPTLLARVAATGVDPSDLALAKPAHLARQAYVVSQFDRLARGEGVARVDPATRFCPADRCLMTENGNVLYNDYQHVTTRGARWLKPLFEAEFKRMAVQP
ncbi:MAG: acyltransferase family protein [Pseudomonadota bacterium]